MYSRVTWSWPLAVAAALAAAGCLPTPEHRCQGAGDCAGGTCVEPLGACAFPDGTCGSSLRYGEGAGALAGACVDQQPDAGVESDEDNDGVVDRLDNCPHVANANQADTTEGGGGDGVGDLCDPQPSARNQILLFDSFAHGLDGRWLASDVIAVDGAVRIGRNGYLALAQPLPRYVEWLVVGTGLDATPAALSVGAGLTLERAGATCSQSTPPAQLRLHKGDNLGVTTPSTTLTPGRSFALIIATTPDEWLCELQTTPGEIYSLRHAPLLDLPTTGYVGVANQGAVIELAYALAISIAAP